nr:LysR family transcriptional regulator [Mameliella alba]
MIREKINDLIAFTAVAEERSFTRAAARLNVSQSALNETRDEPTGTLRIVAVEYAIESILWPKLSPVLKKYPSVNVELVMKKNTPTSPRRIATRAYAIATRWPRG